MEAIARVAGPMQLPAEFRRKLEEQGADFDAPVELDSRPVCRQIKCETCGCSFLDHMAEDEDRCRCRRSRAAAEEVLRRVDPGGSMTLRSLRTVSNGNREALSIAMNIVAGNRRKGLLMTGTSGNGKTHTLIGTCRDALARGRVAAWHNFPDFISRVQDSYSDWDGPGRSEIIRQVCQHEIVLLDDLGHERQSADVTSITYELVDNLYRERKSLILATNLSFEEMGQRYDLAVVDRLRHMCEVVVMDGGSRRNVERY